MSNVKIEGFAITDDVPYEGTFIHDVKDISKRERTRLIRDMARGANYIVAFISMTPEAIGEILGEDGLREYNDARAHLVTVRQKRSDASKRGWSCRRRKEEAMAALRLSSFRNKE